MRQAGTSASDKIRTTDFQTRQAATLFFSLSSGLRVNDILPKTCIDIDIVDSSTSSSSKAGYSRRAGDPQCG